MRKITALFLLTVALLLGGSACNNSSSQDVITSYQATFIDRVYPHGETDVKPFIAPALSSVVLNISAGTADITTPITLETGLTVNAVFKNLRMTYNASNACYMIETYANTSISSGQFVISGFKGQIDANSGYAAFSATVDDTYDVKIVNPPYFNYVNTVVAYESESKQPYALSDCYVYVVPDFGTNTANLTLINFKSRQIEAARNVVIKGLPLQVTPEGYRITANEAQSEEKEKFADIDITFTNEGTAANGSLTLMGEYKITFSASLFIK